MGKRYHGRHLGHGDAIVTGEGLRMIPLLAEMSIRPSAGSAGFGETYYARVGY
ncbi:hypothetical protein [Zoogloea sp.]|uniref:hypothetical protein n=1 Tax=Zoogloea sp. TaxID=49181 RepID=UPI0025EBE17D|nr:hypothetical protein [Zoogloea sp.]